MNKVKIIIDSTCDLSPELVKEWDLEIVPLHVTFKGEDVDYFDGVTITPEEIYAKTEKTGITPTSGARNVGELISDFKKWIDEGYDIVFTGIGSQLSSTFNNANIAKQEFPEGRIEVVDSENLSTGIGLVVQKMVKARNEGKDVHEIAEIGRSFVPFVSAKFCIDKLDYLHKGGRCSGMTSLFASMLKIHPVAKVINGKLTVYRKPRGLYIKAVDEQFNEFLEDLPNIDPDILFVTDSGRMDGEDIKLIERIKEHFPADKIKHTHAGSVVSGHCGPKTIGILYIVKK